MHLLGRLQLGALRLLLLGQDGLHRAHQARALQLEAPAGFARHARGGVTHEGRLRGGERLGALALGEQALLEPLHRGVLEKAHLLRERRLQARLQRSAQLLALGSIERDDVRTALGRVGLELGEGVGDELVGLCAEPSDRLATRHALAQPRHLRLRVL